MKRIALYLGIVAALVASCSIQEENFETLQQEDLIFYASFEQPSEGTRVYANEELLLRWTADDRVSIFNKLTYNQQYKFTGETGDNAGGFRKVDTDEFVTGNTISHVVSVYPYQEGTKISESEVLTLTLPAEQHYAENTFGLGANTMVSVSEDNVLQYKNVGGYLRLSLYGEGVSVSSITLKGNNGEKLAGKATVSMPLDETPTATMAEDAMEEITLVCDTPVELGATAEESNDFWFVIPPVTFSKGFTVSVQITTSGTFEKATSKSITIDRSMLSKMSPMEVEATTPSGIIVFADDKVKQQLVAAFDTDGDGELSYKEAADVSSGDELKAAFGAIKTYKSFDEFQYFTSIESIPDAMFKDWNLLTSIVIPNSITSLGNSLFYGCVSLTAITIPGSVTKFGNNLFDGCEKLASISIPNSVSQIGLYCFRNCTSLTEIILPDAVDRLNGYCFSGCSSLASIDYSDSLLALGDYCFSGCSSLVTLPPINNVRSIGYACFKNCSSLKSIAIPSFITRLEEYCFSGCSSLESIDLPNSIEGYGDYCFQYCSSLTTPITIPETMTRLGKQLFAGCSSLPSIVIPESVTILDEGCLMGCSSMKTITIPESVSTLKEGCFGGAGFISVTIPESVTTIEGSIFYGCPDLTSVSLPSSIKTLEYSMFYNCSSLASITIPESVTSIGNHCFYGCSSLTSVVIPESVQFLVVCSFYGCSSLKTINLPKSLGGLNEHTFCECSSLTAITIPETVTVISRYCFYGCSSLTSVIIPEKVTSIGQYCFNSCTSLASVTVKPSNPPTGGNYMFTNTTCPIYVPAESVSAYKNAQYWNSYASRIQAIPSSSVPIPEAIDLGLPSGLKWASFNLGATKPEEYGDYYAWGETEPYYSSQDPLTWKEGKEAGYDWPSYKWCKGSKNTITKYCSNSVYGYNRYTDNKTVLDPEDDAAYVILGGKWRMPTHDEFTELREKCTWEWTSMNGINGIRVTGPSGNSIFFPAAGWRYNNILDYVGFDGGYWLSTPSPDYPFGAFDVDFNSYNFNWDSYERCGGRSIRPVCD